MNLASLARRLRLVGVGIFIGGIILAGFLYIGRKPEVPEDASTIGFYKASSRQMGVMYGQFGVMVDQLSADLKRPGVQAVIVLLIAAVAAIVCFHFARLSERPADRGPNPGASLQSRL